VRCGKTAEIWKERDSAAGHLRRLLARDVMTVEIDASPRRGEELREDVENGGLARAIGANERVNRPSLNPEVHVSDRHKPLELFDESPGFENVVSSHGVR
jgi:hypothetical protein